MSTGNRVPDSISDIQGLQPALDAKANAVDVEGLLAGKADSIHLHTLTQIEGLIAGGKIAQSLIPQVAITNVYVVASQSQQDALEVETGDIAIRTDTSENFVYDGEDWHKLLIPPDLVQSVNGQIGAVDLTYTDVGAAAEDHGHGDFAVLADMITAESARAIGAEDTKANLVGGNALTGTQTITHATVGAGTAPLVVRNTNAYANPWTQYSQVWLDAAGSAMAWMRNDGSFFMGGSQGQVMAKLFQTQTAGTAAIPCFSTAANGGDINTGMYFPAADVLGFTAGGTERLRVDVNGIQATGYRSADGSTGATGSFTSADGKTVTVKNGLIVSIA